MPPPTEESKSKLFSFRWFFHKNKSSSPSKETTVSHAAMPSSKSCDVTLVESVDRVPKYLFWKLLPSHLQQQRPFRSSFSCSDLHQNASASTSTSATGIRNAVKHPCQSLYNLCKSHSVLTHLDSERTLFIKSQEHPPSRGVPCKLCLSTIPASSMYTLQDCGCCFCITCLYQYLNINIREGNIPVTCPDADCSKPGKILVSEIKEIAGNDALVLFERYKLNLDVELDPAKVWCPAPGCETVCSFQPSGAGVPVQCSTCKLRFCSLCKLSWHGNSTCEEAKKALNEDSDLSASDEESWIKQCPNCRIPIEKDEGCAQMMCYRCKHVFCWHCLTSLDDDFLLRHYDKGPCRNKLGHSRASMIWHRTQVIGIFAGFSFLLLMASPVLLLAAPCFLCCRCRSKFFYEEATKL